MMTRDHQRYALLRKSERTLVTSRGELRLKRRMYRDRETGACHIPLDELLGLGARERLSPKVRMHLVSLATQMSYHRAAQVLEQFMPSVSAMRIWQEVQRLGAEQDEEIAVKRQARYGGGGATAAQAPKRAVSKLYVEADGMWVRVRGQKKHAEVKIVLVYEGKEEIGRGRRKLVGRQVVAGVVSGEEVWEEAVGAFSEQWELEKVACCLVGTDGAAWAKRGVDVFPGAIHRLDLYHLHKKLRSTFGVEQAAYGEVCEALASGQWSRVKEVLRKAERMRRGRAREQVRQLYRYLRDNWDGIGMKGWSST